MKMHTKTVYRWVEKKLHNIIYFSNSQKWWKPTWLHLQKIISTTKHLHQPLTLKTKNKKERELLRLLSNVQLFVFCLLLLLWKTLFLIGHILQSNIHIGESFEESKPSILGGGAWVFCPSDFGFAHETEVDALIDVVVDDDDDEPLNCFP